MRMPHRVLVQRITMSADANLRTQETRATVSTSFPCLVEPLPEREKESILGRISSARYRISWMSGDLRQEDLVKFDGSWYRVREASKATGVGSRCMRVSTAILDQDHGRHEEA